MPFALGERTRSCCASPMARPSQYPGRAAAEGQARPLVVPDKVVTASRLGDGIGLLRVSMFPGVLGMDVARDMSRAVADLACDRLIVDLRGNTGGGIGCLRLMSLMCADRRGVGYSIGRAAARKGYTKEDLPAFDRIPSSKLGVLPLMLRFATAGRSVAVYTERLGARAHHGPRRPAGQRALRERCGDGRRVCVGVPACDAGGNHDAGRLVATSAFKVGSAIAWRFPLARTTPGGGRASKGWASSRKSSSRYRRRHCGQGRTTNSPEPLKSRAGSRL